MSPLSRWVVWGALGLTSVAMGAKGSQPLLQCGGALHPDAEHSEALRTADLADVAGVEALLDRYSSPECGQSDVIDRLTEVTRGLSPQDKAAFLPVCAVFEGRNQSYCLRLLERPRL